MTEKQRAYVQRARAASALVTRRRILDAAFELLAAEPAQGVSVDRVARQAGVSRSTVYLVFGTRTQLFEALARDFLERQGFHKVVEAVRLPDAREAMLVSLHEGCQLYAAGRDVGRALFSLALLDPDAASAIVVLEHGRAPTMRALARRLRDQGQLRPGLGIAEAADVLWVLTSFDTFDQLFTGRGLDAAKVSVRLSVMAEQTLLAPSA